MGAQISSFLRQFLPLSLFSQTSLPNSVTPPPPLLSEGEKFEVFISFRGADVRHRFLSHLFAAMKGKQIHAFIDDDLQRGKDITASLFQIIDESDLSIVIFSQNYPKSEWCLEELQKIHESMKQRKRRVIPVFYEVDPSDVQDLKGNYAIKKQKWRDALVEISNLSGFDSKNYSTDVKLVDDVVDKVSAILCEICPSISHNGGLFGIDMSIKDVEALLHFDSIDDVRLVGIWGMGGIGKTTIASKVFNRNKMKFGGHCFVSNVRETLSTRDGLISLRDKIIRELLRDKDIKIDSPYSVDDSIRRRIRRIKVLLVLDDMLTSTELKSLLYASGLYSPELFSPGSRIIVTSRDSQVLTDVKLRSYIYEAKELKDIEALHLLCWHAFGQNNPQQGYEKLAEMVVRYTHGVPLALVVLGCELKQKATSYWEDALKKFNSISPYEIQKILRISFEGLDRDEKNIFLDVACFLKGKDRDYVVNVLEACGFHAKIGINRLIDKSLLKEEKEKKGVIIIMHDLLVQMRQEIVAEEKESKGHQSRLWTLDDIKGALENNRGIENVEAISLHYRLFEKFSNPNNWHIDYEININPEVFIHMSKLRFLKFELNFAAFLGRNVNFPMGLECLPNSIKYLQWDYFPQNYWPSNYNCEKLVELHLYASRLKKLTWNKPLASLRSIILSGSGNLIKISDLAMAPNLEVVDLSYCGKLVKVGSSLEKLNKLKKFSVDRCTSLSNLPELPHSIEEIELSRSGLRQLPSTVGRLTHLKQLSLSSCMQLEILPSISSLKSLEVLDLNGCSSLVEVGSPLENLKRLTRLDVRQCKSLSLLPELPSSIVGLHLSESGLKQLPSTIVHLTGLKELNLDKCVKLESVPSSICSLTSLRTLNLSKCINLQKLPEDFGNLESLKVHNASKSGLTELPSAIGRPTRLKYLSFASCKKLESLPSSFCNLTSLERLDLSKCINLQKLPEGFGNLKSLNQLDAKECGLTELPSTIGHLIGLKELNLGTSVKLESVPSSICSLTSLRTLDLSYCINLQNMPQDFQNLKSLKKLDLTYCKDLKTLPAIPSNLEQFNARHCISLFNEMKSSSVEQYRLIVHDQPTKSHNFFVDGKQVPNWMKYRNDSGTSISLDLETVGHSINFVFCVVILSISTSSFSSPMAILTKENSKTYKFCAYPYYNWEKWQDHQKGIGGPSCLFLWNSDIDCEFVKQVSFVLVTGNKEQKIIGCGVHPIFHNKNQRMSTSRCWRGS